MDQLDHKKKRQRVSNFADPYSLHGQEKYPVCQMPKKSKVATTGTKTESKKSEKEKKENCYKERDVSESGCSAPSSANAHHSEWQVEPSIDEYEAYKAILYQCSAYAALNEKLSAFAMLDYDFAHNILKKTSPCLVFRQGEHFLCTCDNLRRSYIENVGNCSVEESSTYHKPCYHSSIVKELYEMYIYSNSIDLDHDYSSMERKEEEELGLSEVCEIGFMEDVYAVHSANLYGLVKVSFGNMKCLTCHVKCSHPSQLKKILKKFGNDCPDIIEKIYTRLSKDYYSYELQCQSLQKISFDLPLHLRSRIQQIIDAEFKAVNAISDCPVCNSSLKEEGDQSTQECLFLSNYKMLKVEY
ncbi:uncharacterized protein LOC134242141 [Saccostrea cucullata]|uniref:uncharacterized protein LOC134242141 n=1 Tax=Saccostrea cuccullata TaxID=36930 RepID=UPI002ED61284